MVMNPEEATDILKGILEGSTGSTIAKGGLLILVGIGIIWYYSKQKEWAAQRSERNQTQGQIDTANDTQSQQNNSRPDADRIDDILGD